MADPRRDPRVSPKLMRGGPNWTKTHPACGSETCIDRLPRSYAHRIINIQFLLMLLDYQVNLQARHGNKQGLNYRASFSYAVSRSGLCAPIPIMFFLIALWFSWRVLMFHTFLTIPSSGPLEMYGFCQKKSKSA